MAKRPRWIWPSSLAGYWIHFYVDTLADEIVPAVDYRIPGGLAFAERTTLLRGLLTTQRPAGLSIYQHL